MSSLAVFMIALGENSARTCAHYSVPSESVATPARQTATATDTETRCQTPKPVILLLIRSVVVRFLGKGYG